MVIKVEGILNIDKPRGRTSFSIVALVRRLSGERRVGHAGTLDPEATGVLPVCLGQGTRIIQFFADAAKTYRAEIELGVATDTYDASGKVTQRKDASGITLAQLESALTAFRGVIQQTPPMYSAVKYHGQPLYKLARAGIEVERKSRPAQIYRLEIIEWQSPIFTLEVDCGKGTYIRSLAHDLGQALGCGAYLKNLIRLRYGLFDLKDSVSIPELENAFRYGYWQHLLYPVDTVLLRYSAVLFDSAAEDAISKGSLPPSPTGNGVQRTDYLGPPSPDDEYCRAYAIDGRFLGVLWFNRERGRWQPKKVFR